MVAVVAQTTLAPVHRAIAARRAGVNLLKGIHRVALKGPEGC
jgi:hypothetical protein